MTKYLTGGIIIKDFGNETDHSGETEGYCDFEFKLIEPLRITYGGKTYTYDRLKMVIQFMSPLLSFKGRGKLQADMPIPKTIAREVYDILAKAERGNGKLKDWCFSDELEHLIGRSS